MYVDRINILTDHVYPVASRDGIATRDATDIVANEVGVALFVPDGIRARVAQGVFDTNAESMLRMLAVGAGNAGDAYAAKHEKHDWIQLAPNDVAAVARVNLPADAGARMRDAVSDGYLVVALASPIMDGERAVTPWWRVDLAGGDVLGFGDNGWGFGPGGEDSLLRNLMARLAAPGFRAALGRFGLVFTQQYAFCLAMTTAPLMGSEGVVAGFKLGVVQSVNECVGDAFAIAAMSAVLPLIFLWLERVAKYAAFIPRMPRPPKLPPPPPAPELPMGSGGGGPPGPKTPPKVGVPTEPVPPNAPRENGPPRYSGGDPSTDPFGDTHPDPTKPRTPTKPTPTRPGNCAPPEPGPVPPNEPKDVTDAQIRYAEAYADFESFQQSPERQAAFERFMDFRKNMPSAQDPTKASGLGGDVSKWDPQIDADNAAVEDAYEAKVDELATNVNRAEEAYLNAIKKAQANRQANDQPQGNNQSQGGQSPGGGAKQCGGGAASDMKTTTGIEGLGGGSGGEGGGSP